MPRLSIVCVAIFLTLGLCEPGASEPTTLADEGRQIYRTAIRLDGSPLPALVQNDVPLPPVAASCVNCHRRSGYGISEGGSRSLNLTAPALFEATTQAPIRPAYDDQTLVRAIVSGIAADGRKLDATMPRYELSVRDAAALTAYLRTLGASSPDGVSASELVIATVISTSAAAAEREAVVQVLQRYVEVKNAESRRESERAAASERHYWGRERQRAFRKWQLHVWNLDGAASTWRQQLESYYAEQRPFAIISGTAESDWSQVDDFCEATEVPCLLPLNPSPTGDNTGFYSLYFSTGAALEARVTASHIAQAGIPTDAKVLVVHKNDDVSRAAFDAFQDELAAHEFHNVKIIELRGRTPSPRKWRSMLRSEQADVLVAWLPVSWVAVLTDRSIDPLSIPQTIYTASTFSGWLSDDAQPGLLAERIRHVYPYALPRKGLAQFPREHVWLRQQGFSGLDTVAASKTLYACRVLGVGLADIRSNFSREYLLESLEHALDGTQLTSVYPRTSLGPNQRLLSRGAFVVGLSLDRESPFANPRWIQP